MRAWSVLRQLLAATLCAVLALPACSKAAPLRSSTPSHVYDAATLSKTRVWGSNEKILLHFRAVGQLSEKQHWGWAKCSEKIVVGSGVTYDYDAFGNLIHSTGSTPNNYLFAGEQFDSDLGFYYNRARYLNTATGRFWSMDFSEGIDQEPLSLHKYLYASACPVDRVDPSGNDDLAEVSAAQGIGEELDTQVSPAQALRAEAQAKIADVYFVFGLGNFGGGGKFAGIPFLPIPHAYVYANLKGVNEGERFDVGLEPEAYTTGNLLKSLITTVPGVVNISKTSLSQVQSDSLFMKNWASLSALELPLWRAGMPALATEISTGLQSLFPPSSFSGLGIPYSVFGEGQFNCITFSLSAVGLAKTFEKAPI